MEINVSGPTRAVGNWVIAEIGLVLFFAYLLVSASFVDKLDKLSGTSPTTIAHDCAGSQRIVYVRSGDTLDKIAATYGTTVGVIAAASGIVDPNRINVNQRLCVP